MIKWVAVFTATVIADWLWARWAMATTSRRAFGAALLSGAIIICGGFTTIEFTRDPWLLLPAAAGAFAGTWIAVTRA